MKRKLALFVGVVGFVVTAFAGSGDIEKGAFYSVVATAAPSDASYTFLLDQYLEAKCGRPQSIEHIKIASAKAPGLLIFFAIKSGDVAKAREMIQSMPCEGSSKN